MIDNELEELIKLKLAHWEYDNHVNHQAVVYLTLTHPDKAELITLKIQNRDNAVKAKKLFGIKEKETVSRLRRSAINDL